MSKFKLKVCAGIVGADWEVDLVDDLGYSDNEAIDVINRFNKGCLSKEEENELDCIAIDASSFEWYLKNEEEN